uniref:Cytochrome P450 n=1 Tax=Bionectria ochroleuca TaxID=29856 RepID=A0A0B7KFG1_BIOOC
MAWTGVVGVVGTYFLYLLIAWLFLIFSRRFFFHPFKSIPGPFLAKVTNLYGGIQAIRRRGHLASYENHVRFGSVVRYGPNRLIFNTITAINDIYANPLVTKSEVYVLTRMTPLGNVFDTPEVDEHRRKRKIISQPISEKAMRDFEPTMAEQIDTFIQQLRESCRLSEPINMTKRLEYLGGDVFPKLAFIEPALKILGSKIRNKYRSIIGKMIVNRTSMPKDAKRDLYAYAADSMKGGTSLINKIAPGPQGQIGAGTVGRNDGRGRKDEFQLYDVFTSLHDGPVLKLKERQQAAGE